MLHFRGLFCCRLCVKRRSKETCVRCVDEWLWEAWWETRGPDTQGGSTCNENDDEKLVLHMNRCDRDGGRPRQCQQHREITALETWRRRAYSPSVRSSDVGPGNEWPSPQCEHHPVSMDGHVQLERKRCQQVQECWIDQFSICGHTCHVLWVIGLEVGPSEKQTGAVYLRWVLLVLLTSLFPKRPTVMWSLKRWIHHKNGAVVKRPTVRGEPVKCWTQLGCDNAISVRACCVITWQRNIHCGRGDTCSGLLHAIARPLAVVPGHGSPRFWSTQRRLQWASTHSVVCEKSNDEISIPEF